MAVKTSPYNNIKNVTWIKGDIYNCWYYTLDILRSSLIIEIAKIIIDREAATTTAQKNKGILLVIANKAQEEVFQLAMTKLLHTYITFVMNSPNFFLTSLKEIVTCKNNNICVSLNLSFDISIFSSQNDKLDKFLQPNNIEEDELALSSHKQKE